MEAQRAVDAAEASLAREQEAAGQLREQLAAAEEARAAADRAATAAAAEQGRLEQEAAAAAARVKELEGSHIRRVSQMGSEAPKPSADVAKLKQEKEALAGQVKEAQQQIEALKARQSKFVHLEAQVGGWLLATHLSCWFLFRCC